MTNRYNINPEDLLKFQGKTYIYWKDTEGYYLGCNDLVLEHDCLASANDIIGLTDYDRFPAFLAEKLRDADNLVVNNVRTQQFYETTLIGNTQLDFLSIKSPLIDTFNNKIIGVIGISYIRERKMFDLLTKRENEIINLLGKGKTYKLIAQSLYISKRTVEAHIENIKAKFNVRTKSELLERIL